jgi:hypothetical protein
MPSFASSPPRPVRGGVSSSSSFVIYVLFSFFVTNDDVSDYICIFPTPDTLHQPLFLRLFVGVVLYECVGCWAGYYADRRVRQRRRAGGGEIRSEDEDIIIYSARTRGGREGDGMVGFWDTNNYWDGYLFGFPRGEIFHFLKGIMATSAPAISYFGTYVSTYGS